MLSIGKRVGNRTERKGRLEVQSRVSCRGEVSGQGFGNILCEGGHADSGEGVGGEDAITGGEVGLACLYAREFCSRHDLLTSSCTARDHECAEAG